MSDGEQDPEHLGTSGGGEKFLSFIEKELMPHIDFLYQPSSYRLFMGLSFGGLAVMNAFINHPEMFNSYVAIDPSMWWDRRAGQAHVLCLGKYQGLGDGYPTCDDGHCPCQCTCA